MMTAGESCSLRKPSSLQRHRRGEVSEIYPFVQGNGCASLGFSRDEARVAEAGGPGLGDGMRRGRAAG